MQELEQLKQWIGRRETAVDHVTIPAVQRLSAMLDRDDPMPKYGDAMPVGWHSILFNRIVRHSELGPDGHPKRGDFLPPVPLPRRMFAGNRIQFIDRLLIGEEVRRESTIENVTIKQGRNGALVFVLLKTEIHSPRGLAIVEEQDIVYRGDPAPDATPPPPQPAPATAVWEKALTPDPVMLFRYSALSYVAHRIHYDYPYVTGVEGYPDLIMIGRLTLLLALELAREHAGLPVRSIASRNVRPMFVNRPLTVCGAPAADGRTAALWVMDNNDALALNATVELG
ncbi:MAG: FAS1-like dehydratase domain-containing protein [Burkholderiales bacterium]